MQSKEVRQEVQLTKINTQMDRAYNTTPEEKTKEFKSNKYEVKLRRTTD